MKTRRDGLVDTRSGGVLLFFAAAVWTLVTGAVAGSSPWPMAGLILVAGLSIAVSWVVACRRPALVPMVIVCWALALALVHAGSTFDLGSFTGPLGYANASSMFFALAAVAALFVVITASSRAVRGAGVVAIVLLVPLVLFGRVWAVAILLPGVLIAALLVTRRRGARTAVVLCGAVFAVSLFATLGIGATRFGIGSGPASQLVGDTISGARVQLWYEALTLVATDPLLGVGPGRFADVAPTATRDPDLRWAHNEFLQAGAETGLLGYVLSVGLFAWGFVALSATASGPSSVLGAAALSMLGAHASFDYVLHFPAIAIAGGALLGAALGAASGARETGPSVVRSEPVEAFA